MIDNNPKGAFRKATTNQTETLPRQEHLLSPQISKNRDSMVGFDKKENHVATTTASKPIFPLDYLGKPILNISSDDLKTAWTPPVKLLSKVQLEERFQEYATGESPYKITPLIQQQAEELAQARKPYIQKAMKVAWDAYTKYAFGKDELKPKSKKGDDNFDGFGMTIIQALGTLYLMDMKAEYKQAKLFVDKTLSFKYNRVVNVMEMNVLVMGGLLSAHDMTQSISFKVKALDLAIRLVKACDHSTANIPFAQTDLLTGNSVPASYDGRVALAILSDYLTLALEFRHLDATAYASTNSNTTAVMRTKMESVYRHFQPGGYLETKHGLYPTHTAFTRHDPQFNNDILTFGDMADSAYEYMLKIWIQGHRKEDQYRQLYDKAIDGLHNLLLQKSTPSGLTYLAQRKYHLQEEGDENMDHSMDYKVCAAPAVLALGAYTDPQGRSSQRAQRDMKTARALLYTCFQLYTRMPTGLSPRQVIFQPQDPTIDFVVDEKRRAYSMFGSTMESLYIIHEITKDPIYQEWGWEIFQSIHKFCHLNDDSGYASWHDVTKDIRGVRDDHLPAPFFGETLKYLYLLFDSDSLIYFYLFLLLVFPLKTHNLSFFLYCHKSIKPHRRSRLHLLVQHRIKFSHMFLFVNVMLLFGSTTTC